VKYYLTAMLFIVFDIEIVFLYPWAVIYRQLATFGLVEMVVFAAAVFVSFVYLLANGALDWGPTRKPTGVGPAGATAAERTAPTTIRVGRPAA
jgi:NADH-quinone oxidoreductase subunit A